MKRADGIAGMKLRREKGVELWGFGVVLFIFKIRIADFIMLSFAIFLVFCFSEPKKRGRWFEKILEGLLWTYDC